MIRVRIKSREQLPESFARQLQSFAEIRVADDSAVADLVVIYERSWNRSAYFSNQQFLHQTSVPVVIVSEEYEEPFASDSLLRRDVAGILFVHSSREQILAGLQAAASGLKFVSPVKERVRSTLQNGTLTPRESEVLRLIADGEGNKTIAELLGISSHTVKFHISSIFEKLHVSSRTEAVRAGVSRGLISI